MCEAARECSVQSLSAKNGPSLPTASATSFCPSYISMWFAPSTTWKDLSSGRSRGADRPHVDDLLDPHWYMDVFHFRDRGKHAGSISPN